MDEIGTGHAKPARRHLLTPGTVTRADTGGDADLTRKHGQSNGLRVHGLYFAAVSLVALVLIIAAIVLATTTM
jgi:hypothetical protein